MKKILAFALLVCLLLCGCGTTETKTTEPTTVPSQTQTQTTTVTPTTTPTSAPTEAPTQPPQLEKVTVYLLDKSAIYDSGYTEYIYDENYNISSYKSFTIENELRSTTYFEEKDNNGMACKIRNHWPDGYDDTLAVAYHADGKIKEEQWVNSNFSGYQYEYNQKGDRTEKREYYDGILQTTVYYEYDGSGVLKAVYCEDASGNKMFDCKVENGLITEKFCYEPGSDNSYSYRYKYDKNGNLTQDTFFYEGELIPTSTYTYKAVEVDADRAPYIQEQQRYLASVA